MTVLDIADQLPISPKLSVCSFSLLLNSLPRIAGALYTGIYGVWNIYVISFLYLFTPLEIPGKG